MKTPITIETSDGSFELYNLDLAENGLLVNHSQNIFIRPCTPIIAIYIGRDIRQKVIKDIKIENPCTREYDQCTIGHLLPCLNVLKYRVKEQDYPRPEREKQIGKAIINVLLDKYGKGTVKYSF